MTAGVLLSAKLLLEADELCGLMAFVNYCGERRAHRFAVRHPEQALSAQRALLKIRDALAAALEESA